MWNFDCLRLRRKKIDQMLLTCQLEALAAGALGSGRSCKIIPINFSTTVLNCLIDNKLGIFFVEIHQRLLRIEGGPLA